MEEAGRNQTASREMATAAATHGHEPGALALEFGPHSQLPAVLISPDPSAPPLNEPVARADAGSFRDFLETTQAAEGSSLGQNSDAIWDEAAYRADQRYRSLHGKSAFQTRIMEAARATLALPNP